MTAKTYALEYNGYWLEQNSGSIPAQTGVYCVYACSYNASADTVSIRKLIYIGESTNVRERLQGHEKKPRWKRQLQVGEVLCYNVAPVSIDRVRVEAALINHHEPPENTEYVDNFPFDTTTVRTSGQNAKLDSNFTVYRSSNSLAGLY